MLQNARQLPEWSTDSPGVFNHQYVYDKNGNVGSITAHVNGRQTRSMTYDGLDRLLTATSPMYPGGTSYTYNVLDDLTQVTAPGRTHWYCYNATTQRLDFVRTGSNCTSSPATITLGYDVQGNVANKNATSYAFDYGNRLRSLTVGSISEAYRYDVHGRRTLSYNSVTGNVLSHYGQDGVIRLQQDYRKSKQYSFIYLAGSQVARREAPLGPGQQVITYQHTDALGSPIAVTNSTGTPIAAEASEYEPYGKLLNRTNDDRPGYTGHVMDQLSTLTYMQQRYYDPGIGRFLSVDPVTADTKTGGNFNRYWYAADNPYKFTDPDGRCHTSTGVCMTDAEFDEAWKGEGARAFNLVGSPLGIVADTANGDYQSAAMGVVFSAIPGGRSASPARQFLQRVKPYLNASGASTKQTLTAMRGVAGMIRSSNGVDVLAKQTKHSIPNLALGLNQAGAESALKKAGFEIVTNKDGSVGAVSGQVRVNFHMSSRGPTAEVQINRKEVLKMRLAE